MKFKPLGNRVLVERLEAETVKGGIILPDSAKKKQEKAKVVAVGAGKVGGDGKVTAAPVKVGEVVLMEQYSGQEISLDGKEYFILRGDDIIAIVG